MILAAGVIGFGLLITMSKGAILSLVLGTVCATPLFYKAGVKFRHLLIFLLVIVLFFLIVPTDLVATNYDMFVYRTDNPDLNRVDLWNIAWKEFVRNPILGVGPYCIYIYNRQYAIDDLYTHNFILNELADLGLVGAIPFILLVVVLVRLSYKACVSASTDLRSRWMSIALFVGLLSTLIHGLVEPTFPGREYSVVFWVYISLIALYARSGSTLNQPALTLSQAG
jgi:O-antigen ligase